MAWSAPMTAVFGATFTSSQFNQYIRDNFLETGPAKANSAGGFLATAGPNEIVQRTPISHFVTTTQSRGPDPNFGDLATFGPTVTVTTGPQVFVYIMAEADVAVSNSASTISFEVTGASNIGPANTHKAMLDGIQSGNFFTIGCGTLLSVTPGVNTFSMKYQCQSTVSQYRNRRLTVIPF